MTRRCLTFALGLLLLAGQLPAQEQPSLETLRAAAEQEPDNGSAWYQLGDALFDQESYAAAIEAWKRADELGFAPQRTRFGLARAHALAGDHDSAFAWLERALSAGFAQVQGLRDEPALAGLRDDPRFEQAVEKAERNAYPCRYDPRFKEFDFWIGEWDVFDGDGNLVGRNSIRRRIGGCMLSESWTGAGGSIGRSMNYIDPASGKWVQVWIDGRGGLIAVEGGLENGSMHLAGEHVRPSGDRQAFRGTWTPLEDGRVRQHLEQSRDGGESWYTWFDGYYVRREDAD